MAPEKARGLEVLDLREEDSTLKARVESIEVKEGAPELEIFWHAVPLEEDRSLFLPLGGGVAYVLKSEHVHDAVVSWATVGEEHDWFAPKGIVIVLLTPKVTAREVDPPARAKEWKGRLALMWRTNRHSERLRWKLDEWGGTLEPELGRMNREYYDAQEKELERQGMEDAIARLSKSD